jgi:hypothetical protein
MVYTQEGAKEYTERKLFCTKCKENVTIRFDRIQWDDSKLEEFDKLAYNEFTCHKCSQST